MSWIQTCKWSVAAAVFAAAPALAQSVPEPVPAVTPKPPVPPKFASEIERARKRLKLDLESEMNVGPELKKKLAMVSDLDANAELAANDKLLLAFQASPKTAMWGARSDQFYQRGMRALDQKKWEEAIGLFQQADGEGGARADAALYWTAYAQNKLGKRSEALASLAALRKAHPQSKWLNEANALEVEVKQASGRPVSPDAVDDDDMKLMALNGLMNSNPERALPIIEKILTSSQGPRVKERALFVLSQSDSPHSREILVKIARGASNPDLQRLAVRNLGVRSGKENGQLLSEIYQGQADIATKREILRAFMISGDTSRLAAAAKTEKDVTLRREAIRQLGAARDTKSLGDLLASESDQQVRAEIVNSFMVAGDSARLIDVANSDKDPEVRRRAIQMLGAMGSDKTGAALVQIYQKTSDVETKKAVIRAFMIQGNAKALIETAKSETNPELKREAVRNLSHMRSKEASDFMLELLEK